jgi:hypothetical protein
MRDNNASATSKLYDELRYLVVSKVHVSVSGAGGRHVAKGSVLSGPSEKASTNSGRNSATYVKSAGGIAKDGQDSIGADEAVAMIWELSSKTVSYGGYASRIMKAYHKLATDKSVLGWLAGTARRVSSEDIFGTLRGHKVYRGKLDAYEVDVVDDNVICAEDNEISTEINGIAGDIGSFIEEYVENTGDSLPVVYYKRKMADKDTGIEFWKKCGIPKTTAYRRIAKFNKALLNEIKNIECDKEVLALAIARAFRMN